MLQNGFYKDKYGFNRLKRRLYQEKHLTILHFVWYIPQMRFLLQ